MNLKLGLIFVLIAISVSFIGCASNENDSGQEIIFVKIPPVRNEKLSRKERFWQFQKFLFPQITIPNPITKGLPNDDSLLYVSLDRDGTVTISSQKCGDLQNTYILKNKLTEIFQERTETGVFEPESNKIVKAVLVDAPASTKYGDVLKAVRAVNQSGAAPIVLKIKELPTTEIIESE